MFFGVVPYWFVLGFFAFLVGFGSLIAFTSKRVSGRIRFRPFSVVEGILIAGIIGGVIGLFQPWSLALYGVAFDVLLFCVLAYTLWSHITPRPQRS